jgi:hypothetical protein
MSHGNFSGEPKTLWLTEANTPDRRMQMLEDFVFTDPKGKAWGAPKGYDGLNGASIPQALWTLIGSPYTGDYRRAAIVHDYACDNGADRKEADKMFYHACRAGGCSRGQAVLLYVGVRIGSWSKTSARLVMLSEHLTSAPRVARTQVELNLERFYQQVANDVLVATESDDPDVIEAQVDKSMQKSVAMNFFE